MFWEWCPLSVFNWGWWLMFWWWLCALGRRFAINGRRLQYKVSRVMIMSWWLLPLPFGGSLPRLGGLCSGNGFSSLSSGVSGLCGGFAPLGGGLPSMEEDSNRRCPGR
nr:hypothetical protein CFP56_63653 [Quercus suber]